jgi:hypothetical protein
MNGGRAEYQPFRVFSRNAEIGTGRRATFAGADPVAAVRGVVAAGAGAGGAGEIGRGSLYSAPRPWGEGPRLHRVRWSPDSL